MASSQRSQLLATGLALFFGGIGIHWFYLGRGDKGKWYLLFCWTLIPTLLGIRDAVRLYRMNTQRFQDVLEGDKPTVPRSELPWSDHYWLRLKQYVQSFIGLFVLLIIVVGIRVPSEVDGATPEYPVAYALTMIFTILLFVTPVIMSYLISKDQHELSSHLADISTRRWITILLFTTMSAGLYPIWYIVMRRRRTSTAKGLLADGETDSATDVATRPENGSRGGELGGDQGRPQSEQSETPQANQQGGSKHPSDTNDREEEIQQSIPNSINTGDGHRDEAKKHIKAGDYEMAEQSIERAQEAYQSALDKAQMSNRVDETGLTEQLDSIEQLRHKARQARIEDELSDIEAALKSGQAGQIDQAELEVIESRLKRVTEQADSEARQALQDRIDELETSIETARDRRTQRQLGPPETITSPSELRLKYDALNESEPIGGGGNADVKKAIVETAEGSITVAVKTPRLSGTLHTETVDRLLEEARTWQKFDDHDHVVGVLDYGSEPLPWIAMEYMNGGHLGERAGELPIEQAYWTALGITRAVRYAHRHGVAHLDLKPENVLFATSDDAWDVPKVADWGLSKQLLDHSKSVEGVSPRYAAPEQFDSETYGAVDDVTDIYQLGAVLYELFTGRPPFEGEPTEVMRAVLDDQPTLPSEVDPSLPTTIDDMLMPALAKEKNERYDSVIYIRDALDRHID